MSKSSEGWYPGKNLKKHLNKKEENENGSENDEDSEVVAARIAALKAQEVLNKKDEKWYPGKNLKEFSKKHKSKQEPDSVVDRTSSSARSGNEQEQEPTKSPLITTPPEESPSFPNVSSSEDLQQQQKQQQQHQVSNNVTPSLTKSTPIVEDSKNKTSPMVKPQKEKWYPGKHIKEMRQDCKNEIHLEKDIKSKEEITIENASLNQKLSEEELQEKLEKDRLAELATKAEAKWYPGKHIGTLPRPLLALRRHVIAKRNLQQSTDDQSLRVASLRVSLLRGRALASLQRPYAEMNVEGFEQRTSTAKTSSPDWQNDSAFVFNVSDLSHATLSVHLFDDYNIHHDTCVGRVLVPLNSLLTCSTLAPTEACSSVLKTVGGVLIGRQILTNDPESSTEVIKDVNVLDKFMSPKFGSTPTVRKWYRVFPPAPSMANKLNLDKAKAIASNGGSSGHSRTTENTDTQNPSSTNIKAEGKGGRHDVDHHLLAQFLANNRFETGVEGIPGSAMHRPKTSLGYIELELELTLSVGAAAAYFLSSSEDQATSTSTSTQPDDGDGGEDNEKAKQDKEIEQLQPKILRDNMARLKRAFQASSPLLASSFVRRFVLVPLAIRICFFMPPHEFPLWLFVLIVLHGYLSHQSRKRSSIMNALESNEMDELDFNLDDDDDDDASSGGSFQAMKSKLKSSSSGDKAWGGTASPALKHEREWRKVPPWILIFEDEIGPDTMPKGVIAKIKLLKDTVAKLQSITGKLATTMERSSNLWNWSDPIVSALATVSLAIACAFASLILAVISLRLIFCLVLISVLMKAEIKSIKEQKNKIKTETDIPNSEGNNSEDTKQAVAAQAKKQALLAKSAVASLLAKIPDDAEIIHRTISSLQPITEKEMLREIANSTHT